MEPAQQPDVQRTTVFGFTATHATIIVALIGAIGTSVGALLAARQSLELERTKHDAAADLARQEFETKLIFRAIEGSDSADERTRNLQFFLDAGFLSDPHGKIAKLDPSQYPSKGNTSFDCSKDKDPAAQIICGDPALSARDRFMADQYYKLKGTLDTRTSKLLVEEQLRWLAERNGCAAAPVTAVTCMSEKYDVRIVELIRRISTQDPSVAPVMNAPDGR